MYFLFSEAKKESTKEKVLLGIRKATTIKSLVLSPYTAALCGF